jgi:hypothetical protein
MYRGGLTRSRIATLTGAPTATVGYHLSAAVDADPGLQAAHEQAAAKAPLRVGQRGLARMRELVDMVQETGRYPSRTAKDVAERTLASWLDRRAATMRPAHSRRRSATGWPSCRTGSVLPGRWPMRSGGRAGSRPWRSTVRPGMIGPGTKSPRRGKNTISGSGCIASARRLAAASSSRPRPGRWMMRRRAGARAGNAGANPGTAPDSPTDGRQLFERIAQGWGVYTLAVRAHVQKGHREWASDVSFSAKPLPRHSPSLHKQNPMSPRTRGKITGRTCWLLRPPRGHGASLASRGPGVSKARPRSSHELPSQKVPIMNHRPHSVMRIDIRSSILSVPCGSLCLVLKGQSSSK